MPTTSDRTVPVSVLLPVHNGGRHLAAAVSSILGQTHDELELLAIDDGSTDGSGELLDALRDPRVRVLHQPNRGLVATLNTGLAEARHEIVARMDSDDLSAPRRLELQVRHLQAHPEVAAVGCCYDVVDEHDVVVRQVHTAAAAAYLRRQLYFRNVLPHAGMTFRRSAVLGVGGYRDVGPVEDYDLWVRLALHHDLASLPETLLRYRVSPGGISGQAGERQRQATRDVRSRLHRARPLAPVRARDVLAEGRAHVRTYGTSCPGSLAAYVYDHAWLALVLGRAARLRPALRLAAGVLLLCARSPRSALARPSR